MAQKPTAQNSETPQACGVLQARCARRASGARGILQWADLIVGLQLLANQPASQPPAAGRQPNGRARDPNRWRRNPQHRTAKPHRPVGFCRPATSDPPENSLKYKAQVSKSYENTILETISAQGAQAAQDAQAAQPRPLSDLLLYNL